MKRLTTIIAAALITTIGAAAQCFKTEEEFKNYFKNNEGKLDPIEGIWLQKAVSPLQLKLDSAGIALKLFIVKNKKLFVICRLPFDSLPLFQVYEQLAQKKKVGHYLYRNYLYRFERGRLMPDGGVLGDAELTDSLNLKIEIKRRVIMPYTNSNNKGQVYKVDKDEYTKLFPKDE